MQKLKKPYSIKKIHNKLVIYTKRGAEAGYLRFHYWDDGSKKRNIEIGYINIKKKYRRRGYATLLIKRFLVLYRNKVYISLWTGEEMERSGGYTLYEKCGFMQMIVLNDYYDDGIPTRLFVIKNNDSVIFKKKRKINNEG